jgi:hypothetical protein
MSFAMALLKLYALTFPRSFRQWGCSRRRPGKSWDMLSSVTDSASRTSPATRQSPAPSLGLNQSAPRMRTAMRSESSCPVMSTNCSSSDAELAATWGPSSVLSVVMASIASPLFAQYSCSFSATTSIPACRSSRQSLAARME